MDVLNWITANWKNILAFMGALNVIAQTLTRANKNGTKNGLANKAILVLKKVSSLGMHPAEVKESDDILPPNVE